MSRHPFYSHFLCVPNLISYPHFFVYFSIDPSLWKSFTSLIWMVAWIGANSVCHINKVGFSGWLHTTITSLGSVAFSILTYQNDTIILYHFPLVWDVCMPFSYVTSQSGQLSLLLSVGQEMSSSQGAESLLCSWEAWHHTGHLSQNLVYQPLGLEGRDEHLTYTSLL